MAQNLSSTPPIASPDQEPLVRWTNPAGHALALGIDGTLRVDWFGGSSGYPCNVDLVLALQRTGGSYDVLFAQTVSKPHSDLTPESLDVPVDVSAVVGTEDSILLSLRADGQSLDNWVILEDPLRITIIPEPSSLALIVSAAGVLGCFLGRRASFACKLVLPPHRPAG